MNKKFLIIFGCCAVFLLGSVIIPDVMFSKIERVQTVKATAEDVPIYQTVSGKIISAGEKQVNADVGFIAEKILVKSGEFVKKGDKIIKIDKEKSRALYLLGETPDFDSCEKLKNYITAPCSGRINEISVMDGMPIDKSGQICTIIPNSSLKVNAFISEDVIKEVATNMSVSVTGNAFSGSYSGKIESIGAQIPSDSDMGSALCALITLDEPNEKLISGCSVDVKIKTGVLKNAVCIPQGAVNEKDGEEYVYVCDSGTAKKKKVATNLYSKGLAVIKDGVKNGEFVVSNPSSLSGNEIKVIAMSQNETDGRKDG